MKGTKKTRLYFFTVAEHRIFDDVMLNRVNVLCTLRSEVKNRFALPSHIVNNLSDEYRELLATSLYDRWHRAARMSFHREEITDEDLQEREARFSFHATNIREGKVSF